MKKIIYLLFGLVFIYHPVYANAEFSIENKTNITLGVKAIEDSRGGR